jgi:hypothetical protein
MQLNTIRTYSSERSEPMMPGAILFIM